MPDLNSRKTRFEAEKESTLTRKPSLNKPDKAADRTGTTETGSESRTDRMELLSCQIDTSCADEAMLEAFLDRREDGLETRAFNQVPVHNVHDLLAGGNTARITLHGQEYVLRITKSGKLILTK